MATASARVSGFAPISTTDGGSNDNGGGATTSGVFGTTGAAWPLIGVCAKALPANSNRNKPYLVDKLNLEWRTAHGANGRIDPDRGGQIARGPANLPKEIVEQCVSDRYHDQRQQG